MRHDTRTVSDVAEDALREKSLKPGTMRNYRQTLHALEIADMPFSDLTVPLVTERLNQVLNINTRRKHGIAVRSMFGMRIKCPQPRPRIIDLPPYEDILRACVGDYRVYALSMLVAGMRIGESCIRQDVSGTTVFVDRQRTATGEITSSKSSGPVVVPQWFLDEYARAEIGLAPNTVFIGVKRMFKRAGMTLRPHDLRHAFATRLVDIGASPKHLQTQCRHRDVATSLTFYTHVRQSDLHDLASRMA